MHIYFIFFINKFSKFVFVILYIQLYIFIFIVGPHFYFINNDNNDECLLDKQYLLVEEWNIAT